MTKDESKIKDWRSTGRRKARRELYASYVPYKCVGYRMSNGQRFSCGKTSIEPPKDAPAWFDEIWPADNRVLDYQLQADHESKDFQNNELDYVNWKCASCHKIDDSSTEKNQAQLTVKLWPGV